MSQRVEILSDEEVEQLEKKKKEEDEERRKEEERKKEEQAKKKEDEDAKRKKEEVLVNTNENVALAMKEANEKKAAGNAAFTAGEVDEAIRLYSEAIVLSEGCDAEKERAVFFANRAACHLALHAAAEAVRDCDSALRIDKSYSKCFVRRAHAKEKLDKLDEALADYKAALELGVSSCKADIVRLEPIVKERQAKQLEEMTTQLKGLGNMLLGKFGLSLDNFKMEKNEQGSYSVQFQQNK